MKRILLVICILFFSLTMFSQARYWVGLSGGSWSSSSNWSTISAGAPGASSPTTTNDVIFDNAFNGLVEMDVLPAVSPFTFTINSILITGNSTVTLQRTQAGGGTRIFQLVSTSAITQGLKIDNGSTLIIDANATSGTLNYEFALTGGAGVTGEILGNLHFTGTGTGTGNAGLDLQNDATHYAALHVKNGGVIKYFGNTGNTSPSTGSYLTMENGSTYQLEKSGGSFPPGNWDLNSLARTFNLFGAAGPTFLGNAYGNLEWECPNQTMSTFLNDDVSFNNVNFITNNGAPFRVKTGSSPGNYTMTINGNLDIGDGSFIDIVGSTSTTGTSGKILLKGNLNIQPGGVLTTNGGAGTVNQLELNGFSNQNITVNGFLFGVKLEFIMNGVSATLLTPVTLPGNFNATGANLQLLNGKIITTAANVLRMIDSSSTVGGSPVSFVQGSMKKVGNDVTFTFPLGLGSIYAPISYNSTGMAITDEITAEYIRTNPQGAFGNTYDPGGNPEIIDHISFVEYWLIEKTAGAFTPVNVTLPVTQYSFCKVFATTFVTRFDISNTRWTNCGTDSKVAGPNIPPYETGTITTSLLPAFGAFTLGTSDTYGVNPLPVNLIAFDAIKLSGSSSSVTWQLAACCSVDAKFEIQRAGSDRNFLTIGTIRGSATNTLYTYTDNGLKSGINYYRLKMIDENGATSYTRMVAIMNGFDGLLLTSLAPTTVTGTAMLTVTSSKEQPLNLLIIDMLGRIVQQQHVLVFAGNSSIRIGTEGLAAGTYQLVGLLNSEKTNVLRFVKQ